MPHHDLLTWISGRAGQSLNGEWRSIIDVYDIGIGGPFGRGERLNEVFGFPLDRGRNSEGRRAEYDFDTSPVIEVPGDWNSQIERCHYYEGSMWFRRRFRHLAASDTARALLYFGAANHQTLVYLNGEKIGEHVGGFGPFCFDVTDALRSDEENVLVVRVNNRRTPDGVPTTRTDWFNYGGLTRDVVLVELPATYVRDAVVQLDPTDPTVIDVAVWLDGDVCDQDVAVEVDGRLLGRVRTSEDGHGIGRFPTPTGLALWSPSEPTLHEVTLRSESDEVRDHVGFRTVAVDGTAIVINGQRTFLSGISLHDEALGANAHRVQNAAQARELLSVAKELGCNFVRLAHYQHNEYTVRACDELGLMAWCELPVYWGIDFDNDATYANAEQQLTELIVRDRNRAAVITWSVANETVPGEARTEFLAKLVAVARSLDPTRLITAALFARPADGNAMSGMGGDTGADWVIDDPLGKELDLLAVNEYHGWYYGSFDRMATLNWSTPYDKPLIISEFGADAASGLRGELDESWTEDFQAEVYRHQFEMLSRIPFLAGTTPWILKDFRAPFRLLPGVQDGFNRKGLIDPEGNHKLSFEIVKKWNQDHLLAPT